MRRHQFLVSKRTYLCPVEVSDARLIQKWHNDPEIRKSARLGELPVTYEKEETDIALAKETPGETYLMIIKKTNDSPIGFIRLNYIDRVSRNMWLRMMVGDKRSQGKGYAREALDVVLNWLFTEQNVHRVTLETYENNKGAIRFFEGLGFKQEGIIREAVYVDGRYYNIISFGLLRKEYGKL
jgi:RimJ/RimL family protein N-acetyltransferase